MYIVAITRVHVHNIMYIHLQYMYDFHFQSRPVI